MSKFVTVEGRTLYSAMKIITATVEKKCTIPILSNVRLKHDGLRLFVSGTDLDVVFETSIDTISGHEAFDITIRADTLAKISRAAGPATVRIDVNEFEEEYTRYDNRGREKEVKTRTVTRATITVDGGATFNVETLPASDFPEMTVGELDKEIVFTNGRLGEIFGRVAPFISTEETRYYLNGIHLTNRYAEATDGHRFGRVTYDKEAGKDVDVIIPNKVCRLLMAHAGPDVRLHLNKAGNRMQAATKCGWFTFKPIDGTFPDTDRIIPKEPTHSLDIDVEAFSHALRLCMIVSTERGRACKIYEDEGRAMITMRNPDYGDATAAIGADWPKDFPAVGFNAAYLLGMMPKTGRVKLRTSDDGGPALLDVEGQDDTIRVIMPMRV